MTRPLPAIMHVLHCIRFSRWAGPDPGEEAELRSSSSPSIYQMSSNLPSRTSFLATVKSLPRWTTPIPAQSITGVRGSKSNQRRNGSSPTTSQENAPICGFALGMTDVVTLSTASRLPTSRKMWRNKSEFQYTWYTKSCRVLPFLFYRSVVSSFVVSARPNY